MRVSSDAGKREVHYRGRRHHQGALSCIRHNLHKAKPQTTECRPALNLSKFCFNFNLKRVLEQHKRWRHVSMVVVLCMLLFWNRCVLQLVHPSFDACMPPFLQLRGSTDSVDHLAWNRGQVRDLICADSDLCKHCFPCLVATSDSEWGLYLWRVNKVEPWLL